MGRGKTNIFLKYERLGIFSIGVTLNAPLCHPMLCFFKQAINAIRAIWAIRTMKAIRAIKEEEKHLGKSNQSGQSVYTG